ncbi:MAG: hypothetical protein JSS53_06925 [Proteobacteria bacterium]|nr:hypothetical protein [Pseudomonadota bacterium]
METSDTEFNFIEQLQCLQELIYVTADYAAAIQQTSTIAQLIAKRFYDLRDQELHRNVTDATYIVNDTNNRLNLPLREESSIPFFDVNEVSLWRLQVTTIRTIAINAFESETSLSLVELQTQLRDGWQALFQKICQACETFLGPAPCLFAWVDAELFSLGFVGLYPALSPKILVQNKDPMIEIYFEHYAYLLHLFFVSLRESDYAIKIKTIDLLSSKPIISGVRLDWPLSIEDWFTHYTMTIDDFSYYEHLIWLHSNDPQAFMQNAYREKYSTQSDIERRRGLISRLSKTINDYQENMPTSYSINLAQDGIALEERYINTLAWITHLLSQLLGMPVSHPLSILETLKSHSETFFTLEEITHLYDSLSTWLTQWLRLSHQQGGGKRVRLSDPDRFFYDVRETLHWLISFVVTLTDDLRVHDGFHQSYSLQQKLHVLLYEGKLQPYPKNIVSPSLYWVELDDRGERQLCGGPLHPLVASQLITLDKGLNTKKTFSSANHPVHHLTLGEIDLYAKLYPELPGMELAASVLGDLICGEVAPAVMLTKLSWRNQQGEIQHEPLLFSIRQHGVLGTEVCEKNSKQLKELDPYWFTLHFLLTLLIQPEDAKPENLILQPFLTKNLERRYRWWMIDNDHAFQEPIVKNGQQTLLQMKSFLLCLRQMKSYLDTEAVLRFLSLNPFQLLQAWLLNLEEQDLSWQLILFDRLDIQRYLTRSQTQQRAEMTTIPIKLERMQVQELYVTFCRIQKHLHIHRDDSLTAIALLSFVHPQVALLYESMLNQSLPPMDRFNCLTTHAYFEIGKGQHRTLIGNPQVRQSGLRRMVNKEDILNREKFTPGKCLQFFNEELQQEQAMLAVCRAQLLRQNPSMFSELIPYHQELVINDMAFQANTSQELQIFLINLLIQNKQRYYQLRFRGWQAIAGTQILLLLQQSPQLKELDISECNLGDGFIDQLTQLPNLALTTLVVQRNVMTSFKLETQGIWKKYHPLEKLTILNLDECQQLRTISITSHNQLQTLSLQGIENISAIKIQITGMHKKVDLRKIKQESLMRLLPCLANWQGIESVRSDYFERTINLLLSVHGGRLETFFDLPIQEVKDLLPYVKTWESMRYMQLSFVLALGNQPQDETPANLLLTQSVNNLNEKGLIWLESNHKKLQQLSIRGNTRLVEFCHTSESMINFLDLPSYVTFASLTKLELDGCIKLMFIQLYAPMLVTMSVKDSPKLTDIILTNISLINSALENNALKELVFFKLPKLEALAWLHSKRHLTRLTLNGLSELKIEVLNIDNFTSLQSLTLIGCNKIASVTNKAVICAHYHITDADTLDLSVWHLSTSTLSALVKSHKNINHLKIGSNGFKLINLLSLDCSINLTTITADMCCVDTRRYIDNPVVNPVVALTSTADCFATFDPDNSELILWNLKTGQSKNIKLTLKSKPWAIAFTHDDQHIMIDCKDGSLYVYDLIHTELVLIKKGSILPSGFFYDNYSASSMMHVEPHILVRVPNQLQLLDLKTGALIRSFGSFLSSLNKPIGEVTAIAVPQHDRYFVAGSTVSIKSTRYELSAWSMTSGCRTAQVTLPNPTTKIAITRKGEIIVVGTKNGDLYIYRYNHSGKMLEQLVHHNLSNEITHICISHNEQYFIAATKDNYFHLLEMEQGKILYFARGSGSPIASIATTPDDEFIFTVDTDNAVKVWLRKAFIDLTHLNMLSSKMMLDKREQRQITLSWPIDSNALTPISIFTDWLKLFSLEYVSDVSQSGKWILTTKDKHDFELVYAVFAAFIRLIRKYHAKQSQAQLTITHGVFPTDDGKPSTTNVMQMMLASSTEDPSENELNKTNNLMS